VALDVEVIGTAAIASVEVERLATLAAASAGVEDGHLAVEFVDGDRIRDLNREHRAKDTPTDVLSFPIDGTGRLPDGEPRALGDVVLCPEVIGDEWHWPLVHGLLHLLGHEHGPAMEARERVLLP
jgi:probable rRNA maturation factor